MPVPCVAQPPRMPTSRRRGSIAAVSACQQKPVPVPLPSRLTARRCSLGRILVEDEDEALTVFSKYQSGFARRLKKAEAVTMLQKEFQLDQNEAELMFSAYDKDGNEVMSLWEFRQFYQTVGNRAQMIVQLFKSLEKESSGVIDMEKAFDSLRDVESAKGKLTDEDIEMLLMTTAGEAKEIDFSKFLNMMCRIKVFRG